MRMAVPLGMNMCSPFRSISTAVRPPSLIPPPRNVIEDETRRNTFWLIYCAERLHGLGNGWAVSVDDDDISQMMPVLSEQFEHSVRRSFDQTRRPSLIVAQILVSPADRQWAHTRRVLLQNPPAVTDLTVGGAGSCWLLLVATLHSQSTYYAAGEASSQLLPQTLTPLSPGLGSPTLATSEAVMAKIGH